MKLDSLGRGTPPIAIGSLASLPLPARLARRAQGSKTAWEGLSTTLFALGKLPRAPQEGFRRIPEGFRVEDTIRAPFWSHFGGPK